MLKVVCLTYCHLTELALKFQVLKKTRQFKAQINRESTATVFLLNMDLNQLTENQKDALKQVNIVPFSGIPQLTMSGTSFSFVEHFSTKANEKQVGNL